MIYIFYFMIFAGLAATLASLVMGLVSMGKGGDFHAKYGNMFMRWRLIAQGAAVLGVVGVFWQTGAFS